MSKKVIIDSFGEYDAFLSKINESSKMLYPALFSIRTVYTLSSKIIERKKGFIFFKALKILFVIFIKIFSFPFVVYQLTIKKEIIFLCAQYQLSVELGNKIPVSKIEKKYSFHIRFQGWFLLIFKYFSCLKLFFTSKNIDKKKILYCLTGLFEYLCIYEKIHIKGIKVIVVENDIYPLQVAIIQRAKESGIKTIKVEESFIDTIQHNNVFCEYYFCPGEFYRKIRDRFEINKELKYLSGGIVRWDKISQYKHFTDRQDRNILFICQHSFVSDETFYIDELLSVMPKGYVLYIKTHPRDFDLERFNIYLNNPKCEVIQGKDIDNYEWISHAHYCFSVSSVLSVEAKHLLENSFFIHYEGFDEQNFFDFDIVKDYFDVISSREDLLKVFSGKFKAKDKRLCYKGFNQGYPDSVKILRDHIDYILREKEEKTILS